MCKPTNHSNSVWVDSIRPPIHTEGTYQEARDDDVGPLHSPQATFPLVDRGIGARAVEGRW